MKIIRTISNGEKYRVQRNLVTKLKKYQLTHTFKKDVWVGQNLITWKTIKPYLSQKNANSNSKIILSENKKLITDQKEVCEI